MKEKRRNLTKKERGILWYESNGYCQGCGKMLDPGNWHADHIVPFLLTNKTNIHEMQALCPKCNLVKGARMRLRKHQRDMLEICESILAGRQITRIICDVTPGAGKSGLPIILAKKLIPAKYSHLCWIVPRKNLRSQGEESFTDPLFRQPFILGHDNLIIQSVNDYDPSRGYAGHITTYQAITTDPKILVQEFKLHNYILFLDEPHHSAEGSPTEKALKQLVEHAGLLVMASGTLERGDKRKISFLPYKAMKDGTYKVDFTETESTRFIRYSRKKALSREERAIVKLEFHQSDTRAQWVDRIGDVQNIDSFYDEDIDEKAALRTALETSFAFQLIDKGVKHWQGYKTHGLKNAKLLVVAPRIDVAKVYLNHLKSLGINCAIVHSKQKEKVTLRIIKNFKKGRYEVLVTVAMAYEGLDVPEITHVICLTLYRSKPWLEQCFARANRPKGKKNRGYIFTPDDPDMNRIVAELKLDQLENAEDKDPPPPRRDGPGGPEEDGIIPQESQLTDSRAFELSESGAVSPEQYRTIEKAIANNPNLPDGLSVLALHQFMLDTGWMALENGEQDINVNNAPLITPTKQRNNLKESIEVHARRCDKEYFNMEWGKVNKEIYKVFKKPRKNMTLEELQNVWRYLQEYYPLKKA